MIMVISDCIVSVCLSLQEPSAEENGKGPLTVAQKKAQNIMESFENPFRMVSNSVY